MAITRQLSNGNKLTDWTTEVNDVANQYGVLNGMNLFVGEGVSQETIVFDKEINTITLIPTTNRRAPKASRGKDRKHKVFSLVLPYFEHKDYVTPQDIQGHRMPGTADSPETLANVIATKIEDMRLSADQTREYMKVQAVKGLVATPDGTLYNMFDEFGITQDEIDFDLGNPDSDIDKHVADLKRTIAKKALAGARIGRIQVMVTPHFFDKLVSHPKVREAFLYYSESQNRRDAIRGDLQTFEAWGVMDTFEYKGILFWTYDAIFNVDDGDSITEVNAVGNGLEQDNAASQEGYTLVDGLGRNGYRGYFGAENTLSGANRVGSSEMYLRQYTDPRDKFHEMELEMSSMYLLMKPQVSVKVISNT